jgi:tetratricopeptide (TPR) repeat protein
VVLDFSSLALDAGEWLDASYSLGNLQRNDEMLVACDRALAIDPNFSLGWKNKGVALDRLERYDEANLGAGEVDFRTADTDELRALAERFLRRELVNRISGVIGFRPLDSKHLGKILDQILTEKTRLFETEKGLIIEVDQLARSALLDRGYNPELGARPLERAVDEWVVQPLVDAWFANQLKAGRIRFTVAAPAQSSPRDLPNTVTALGGARGRFASSSANPITFWQD